MNKNTIKILKNIRRAVGLLFSLPFYILDFLKFKSKSDGKTKRFKIGFLNGFYFLFDKTISTPFDRHYVYHTAWAARVVKKINPEFHIDISSSLFFSSIVSAFVPVRFYDFRPANLNLSNLSSQKGDLLALPFEDGSVNSISCMHTVEHIGLGRYGDTLDYDGDLKAIDELKRVMKKDGNLIFVVPIGIPVLRFNGVRIYSYEQIIEYFKDMELIEFSLIHEYEEDGGITINASKELAAKEEYGCGCFWFKKGV